jgi:hypothetical protein
MTRRPSRQEEGGGLFERKRLAANMRIGQKFHLTHPLGAEPNRMPPITSKDANPCLFGSYVRSFLHLAEEWLQLMRLFETCFEQAWFQSVFCCPHRPRHLDKHISALTLPQPNAFSRLCKFSESILSQTVRTSPPNIGTKPGGNKSTLLSHSIKNGKWPDAQPRLLPESATDVSQVFS